jgi:L-2-hydroxyglutarate oxidase LhgO
MDVQTVVIGAGVVGLAAARALTLAGHEVMVLEQHAAIGTETSSRNSEVIHAGIYYPPGSLRAQLCVRGKELLYRFCAEHGVAHRRCGKLLVATDDGQLAQLAAIGKTAARNGVGDLELLSSAAARALEPELACVAALLSPSTGIIDSHAFMLALQGQIEACGGAVVLRCPVLRIEKSGAAFRLFTGGDDPAHITTANLVNAAGLAATRLAQRLAYGSDYAPPTTYYAKGQYYALSGRSPFTRHIYPMPSGAWLGLHATVDIGARCKFGPDITWVPDVDYGFAAERLGDFLASIRSYYPGLEAERLHPDYTGIRPKLYRDGEPAADFAIHGPSVHGEPGLVALFGIESPGLTAALAIGEMVRSLLVRPEKVG